MRSTVAWFPKVIECWWWAGIGTILAFLYQPLQSFASRLDREKFVARQNTIILNGKITLKLFFEFSHFYDSITFTLSQQIRKMKTLAIKVLDKKIWWQTEQLPKNLAKIKQQQYYLETIDLFVLFPFQESFLFKWWQPVSKSRQDTFSQRSTGVMTF